MYHFYKAAPPNKRAKAEGGEMTCVATQLMRGKAGMRGRVLDTQMGRAEILICGLGNGCVVPILQGYFI